MTPASPLVNSIKNDSPELLHVRVKAALQIDLRNRSIVVIVWREEEINGSDVTELIGQLDGGGEIRPKDVPLIVKRIADELATLIRLGGAVAATLLRNRENTRTAGVALSGGYEAASVSENLALRVKDAAKMLGVSRSKMYELIGKGQIGVVRLGGSIRVPRRELTAW